MPDNIFGTWDDMRVDLATAKTPPANAPTWRLYDFGITGGIQYYVQGFAVNDTLDFKIQTSHSMQLNTFFRDHLHGILPTSDVGKRINWQLDAIVAGVYEDFSVVAGSPFTAEEILTGGENKRHNLFDVADLPGNTTLSTVFMCKLTRIASTVDEYPGEAYLMFNDGHYIKDKNGSMQELMK